MPSPRCGRLLRFTGPPETVVVVYERWRSWGWQPLPVVPAAQAGHVVGAALRPLDPS